MTNKLQLAIFITLLCLGLMMPLTNSQAAESIPAEGAVPPALLEGYDNIPLHFEPNQGQVAASEVGFISRGNGYTMFATPDGLTLSLRSTAEDVVQALQLSLEGANPQPSIRGLDELPGVSNYLIGDDPAQWQTNAPNYGKVKYEQVYPGIDLILYGNQRQLEYDFVVAPGADPGQIELSFAGADALRIDQNGDLVIGLAGGEVRQKAPLLYQEVEGERREIEGGFVLSGQQVSFQVGEYNQTLPFVIDPVLIYSTFLGGSDEDYPRQIAVDSAGNAYIAGYTYSANFPTTPGAYQSSGSYTNFVTKLNPTGSALVYSTYLNAGDIYALAVDSGGNAIIAGAATYGLPTTAGAYDTGLSGPEDGYVIKLNATGSALVYGTYLGGSNWDSVRALALDSTGAVYVTGFTNGDFPVTAGAYDTTYNGGLEDIFVAKLNSTGSTLVYSTYVGGSLVESASAIAVDGSNNVYVSGLVQYTGFPTTAGVYDSTFNGATDLIAFKLNAAGSAVLYSTYLGGSGDDTVSDMKVDGSGNLYLFGNTPSSNFPTTFGAYDRALNSSYGAFLTKLNSSGSALSYSTYLEGANATPIATALAINGSGHAYLAGSVYASGANPSFPTTPGAYDPSLGSTDDQDIFITKFNASGSALLYSTLFGSDNGSEETVDMAVDSSGDVLVVGHAYETGVPTTAGAYDRSYNGYTDGFVFKLHPDNAPTISAIADQITDEDTPTGPLSFTIADMETPATSLTVSGSSSNTTLIPSSNIVFGGSGSSRIITLTPAANQSGSATITVLVSDGASAVSETLTITVSPVNDAPILSSIADQSTEEDTSTGAIAFDINDIETATSALSLSVDSSNPALVPVSNITLGGTGTQRTITITPAANQFGVATITTTVSDGNLTSSESFVLTVNAVNDTPTISSIADQATDEDVAVGPISFTIVDVESAVGSLSLSASSSDPALVSVGNVVFGGSGATRTVTVTPALNGYGSVTLTLTVGDGQATANSSFLLTVHPVNDPPTITNIPDQTTDENTAREPISFSIGDAETAASSLIVSAASSNPVLAPPDNIVLAGNGTDRTVSISPADNQSGSATITLTVSDGDLATSTSFGLTVDAVNDAPTISSIPDQLTAYGTPKGPIAFTISDVEKAADLLTLDAASSNPTLVPAGNIVFGGSGTNRTVTLTPVADQYGSTTITLTVSDDNLVATTSFVLTVNSPADDTDGDGMPDGWELDHTFDPLVNDAADDADHDGLSNRDEYLAGSDPQRADTDGDKVGDALEVGSNPANPLDTDNDGSPDYNDLDDDADNIPTAVECPAGPPCPDSDNDGISDYLDADSDGDGIADRMEGTGDLDSDGHPNFLDEDSDGDGLLDYAEGTADPDGEGIPNYLDGDSDGDGIPDSQEGADDPDNDGQPSYLDTDSDNNGIHDRDEGGADSDGDGIPNYLDLDNDGDGIADSEEGLGDADGDGRPNHLDEDSDNDGISDGQEGVDDQDNDGTPNYLDEDSDNDGISDRQEGVGDQDSDGTPNYLDEDSDNDGIKDRVECPAGTSCPDSDKDGVPDYLDPRTDTDGDGIPDAIEDADKDGDPFDDDADRDNKPNHQDLDSDGDGLSDKVECPMGLVCPDTDGDGTYDFLDTDSDNDGKSDARESGDNDGDGIPNYLDPDDNDGGLSDSDGDGLSDRAECPSGPPCPDSDGDGTPDYLDSNNDVVPGLFLSVIENDSEIVSQGTLPLLSLSATQVSSATHAVKTGDVMTYTIRLGNNRPLTTTVNMTVTFQTGFGTVVPKSFTVDLKPYGQSGWDHTAAYSQAVVVTGPATGTVNFQLQTSYGLNWTIVREMEVAATIDSGLGPIYLPIIKR